MIRTFCLALAAASALAASPALAQDDRADELIVSFGAGPQIQPKYPGADEYGFSPLFGGHVRREGDPIPAARPTTASASA